MRSGQALIVVLLLLTVLIVVGLSVASRSVTEVSLTTTEEESSRALSAAEAGVEAVINKSASAVKTDVGPTPGDQNYTVGTQTATTNTDTVTFPDLLKSGDSVTLNLTGYNPPGIFKICWGDSSITAGPFPALEVILYYYDNAPGVNKFSQTRNIWEATDSQFSASNVASPAVGCPTDRGYKYSTDVSLLSFGAVSGDTLYFMRLKLLFNSDQSHYITVVSTTGDFLTQGTVTPVTGQAGQTTRKVQVFERTPQPLSIFDFALLAGGSIQ